MILNVCYSSYKCFQPLILPPASLCPVPSGVLWPPDWLMFSSGLQRLPWSAPHWGITGHGALGILPPCRGASSVWREPWTGPEQGCEPKWTVLIGPTSKGREELIFLPWPSGRALQPQKQLRTESSGCGQGLLGPLQPHVPWSLGRDLAICFNSLPR